MESQYRQKGSTSPQNFQDLQGVGPVTLTRVYGTQ